ncbi:MAG TPA: GspH/FimT family pseudopilin [Gemmatimonadales bacterium]|nr:GspH/FimT family pseudopilin [Gemmatimonadales bacterium]
MQRAYSLPELVLVLALAGVLLAIALPRLPAVLDGIEVQAAAGRLAAAHQRARMMAVAQSRVLVLTISQSQVSIRPREAVVSVWSEPGPAASGVILAGVSRQFTFSPEGLTLGLSNATLRLTRGLAARSVIVSRLGRVRIVR